MALQPLTDLLTSLNIEGEALANAIEQMKKWGCKKVVLVGEDNNNREFTVCPKDGKLQPNVERQEGDAEVATPITEGEAATGGARKKKKPAAHAKTAERVMVNGKPCVVYVGPRGGKYVKKSGAFVPLSQLK